MNMWIWLAFVIWRRLRCQPEAIAKLEATIAVNEAYRLHCQQAAEDFDKAHCSDLETNPAPEPDPDKFMYIDQLGWFEKTSA